MAIPFPVQSRLSSQLRSQFCYRRTEHSGSATQGIFTSTSTPRHLQKMVKKEKKNTFPISHYCFCQDIHGSSNKLFIIQLSFARGTCLFPTSALRPLGPLEFCFSKQTGKSFQKTVPAVPSRRAVADDSCATPRRAQRDAALDALAAIPGRCSCLLLLIILGWAVSVCFGVSIECHTMSFFGRCFAIFESVSGRVTHVSSSRMAVPSFSNGHSERYVQVHIWQCIVRCLLLV